MRAERQKAEKEAAKKSKGASGSAKPDTCIVNPPLRLVLGAGSQLSRPRRPPKVLHALLRTEEGVFVSKKGGRRRHCRQVAE